MSDLRSKNFRADRKHPSFIRIRIILFGISVIWNDFWRYKYGGVLEMAQKVIEGGQSHVTHFMHNFEMAQNSNHLVSLFSLRNLDHVPKLWVGSLFLVRKPWDGSKFEQVNIPYFLFEISITCLKFNSITQWFEFWAISRLCMLGVTCDCLLRWLFEPSQGPSCIWFQFSGQGSKDENRSAVD